MLTHKISITFLATLAIACGPNASGPMGGDGDGDGDGDGTVEESSCDQMDILFVIDDSGSMDAEQANLIANFPQFITVVHEYLNGDGEPLDYRVGVTTTGVTTSGVVDEPPIFGIDPPPIPISQRGADGELQAMAGGSRWIGRADGALEDLAATFAAAAEVGTSGPGIEMPLRAVELALSERVADGTNAGYLRDDSLFALVILTDEDDCSQRGDGWTIEGDSRCDNSNLPISEFAGFLDNAAGARGRWATAVIAGETDCSSEFGSAVEASRLKDFVSEAGGNGVFSSICAGDLSGALSDALDTFEAACESFPPVE